MDAEADVLVVGGPVAPEALVPRRPRRAAVLGLEGADALHDREEAVGVVGLGDEARDPEVPGRLVRGIVPALAAVLAREGGEERPGLAVVAALEDARRLDSDEQPVAGPRERRHLGDPAAVLVAVGEALARVLPGLAQVAAAPDGGAVPLARGGGEDRAGVRVVDGVVDGPSFAVRAAQRPVAAVVALEHEGALAGCDGQQCLRHRFAPQRSRDCPSSLLSKTVRPPETHRFGRPRSRRSGQPASGSPVSSRVFRPLRTTSSRRRRSRPSSARPRAGRARR